MALLAADSAGPECDDSAPLPYSVYDVEFTCPAAQTGRIRLDMSYQGLNGWLVEVEPVDGDPGVTAVEVYGHCDEEGGTAQPTALYLTMVGAVCSVDLETDVGSVVECDPNTIDQPCTLLLEGVE